MKTLALLAALLALACSPPPDPSPSPPDPGKVKAISQAVVITPDGPYPARIEIKINYTPNYDDGLNRGFWSGTVSGQFGTSWTNRTWVGPSYAPQFICPTLWVYLGRPDGAGGLRDVAYADGGLLPYTRHQERGTWRDAQTGFTINQTMDCSYKIDNIGINRTDNVNYKLWVGLDCNANYFGGYLPGRNTWLAENVDYWSWNLSPSTPPESGAPSPRYMIKQSGPGVYGAHSLWQNISFGCANTSRRIPSGGTLPNVVSCASFYVAGLCDSWYDLGGLQW